MTENADIKTVAPGSSMSGSTRLNTFYIHFTLPEQ